MNKMISSWPSAWVFLSSSCRISSTQGPGRVKQPCILGSTKHASFQEGGLPGHARCPATLKPLGYWHLSLPFMKLVQHGMLPAASACLTHLPVVGKYVGKWFQRFLSTSKGIVLAVFIFLRLKWNLRPFGDGLNMVGHHFARLIEPAILQTYALSP